MNFRVVWLSGIVVGTATAAACDAPDPGEITFSERQTDPGGSSSGGGSSGGSSGAATDGGGSSGADAAKDPVFSVPFAPPASPLELPPSVAPPELLPLPPELEPPGSVWRSENVISPGSGASHAAAVAVPRTIPLSHTTRKFMAR